ncbi:ImmA/IrrE family metallo-endopeptidase, partial [candidate division WOR-3 bacterium]|nr:ImmA/IrrE family metallo-endopeptidase [candidate division WOR-3 bacterium]
AKKMKTTTARTIENWEKGEGAEKPTFAHLERLASIYKRPITAFLLPTPPEEPSFPKDFRTHPSEEKKPLDPKTYLAIRKARRFQYSAIELFKELGEPVKKLSMMANLTDDPEELAERLRTQLDVKDFYHSASHTTETALEEWIRILEKNGVLVFQISISKNKEIRGFSLVDEDVPVVVLRRSDEPSAKIFTLFHEFAHLLLREGGICDLEETETSQSIETFSNHFAGAFLVPKNELLNHPLVKANEILKEWPEDILKDIARYFKVSKEVILRRLLILNKTTKAYYRMKHKEWKGKYKGPFGRGRNEIKICIQERGKKYIFTVFRAYEQNKINNISVADYLGVKLDRIPKVKEAI